MFRLIPRDEGFFDLFEKAAKNAFDGANALSELFNNYSDASIKSERITELEHGGDKLTHETMTKLNKTFITPIDRDDIHRLITRLDDVIDLIDGGVNRMILYRIPAPTEDAKKMAAVLIGATKTLVELLPTLRNPKNTEGILKLCIDVNTFENEGDHILHRALENLFLNGSDPVTIIKWKDIYEIFEAATDRCEDVANIVEGIAIKNA